MNTAAAQRDRQGWERLAAAQKPEGHAFINGRYAPARDGRVFKDVCPIDGQVILPVARCGPADADTAVMAARTTFEQGLCWRPDPREGKRVLRRFAELIRGFRRSGAGRDRSPLAIDKHCELKTIWTAYR